MRLNKFQLIPIFILLNLFTCIVSKAQIICDQAYMREYKSAGNIEPFGNKSLDDGGVLVAGKGTVSATSVYKAMAIKLSPGGAVDWSILLGGNVDDRFTGITLLKDGSYLLHGTTTSFGHAAGKILLARVSNTGNLIWSRQLGLPGESKDGIKAIKQFTDGDLIGTFNSNDSSDKSSPVVFKMGLDGTIKWARLYDNTSASSFTSIGFDKTTIYASGFYTEGKKSGVITTLNSIDGSIIAAQKIYINDDSYDQQVTNMEVYNNEISYGLWITNDGENKMRIHQATISGKKIFGTIINNDDDTEPLIIKRTPKGFLFLWSVNRSSYIPLIISVNQFYQIQWRRPQSDDQYNQDQKNFGLDVTPAGGSVSAGYSPYYTNEYVNRMIITRTNSVGETGNCKMQSNNYYFDTASVLSTPFFWNEKPQSTTLLNESISLATEPFKITERKVCDSTYCKDITPLPAGCNKTSLIEYRSDQPTILRDFIRTEDGGKIAVGNILDNGLLVKLKDNGDVNWAKNVGRSNSNNLFNRIIQSNNKTLFAFANKYWDYDNYAGGSVRIYKLDQQGNILGTKEIRLQYYVQLIDVYATKDGGCVLLLNNGFDAQSSVMRIDANLGLVWIKQTVNDEDNSISRSIYCTDEGVYIASDYYYGNMNKIGLKKIDFATGKVVWSKSFLFQDKSVNINKLIVSDGTLYTFLNNLSQKNIFLLKVTDAGSLIGGLSLTGNELTDIPFNYEDQINIPSVTITPEKDFVMSNQVKTSDGLQLNISRFDKNGKVTWSKNYPGLSSHFVYNIHPEADGFSIAGSIPTPSIQRSNFSNTFILKVDSNGEIIKGASGNCATEAVILTTSPIVVEAKTLAIEAVDLDDSQEFSFENSDLFSYDIPYDATLFCNQKSNCPPAVLSSLKNDCKSNDPLVYFLKNNQCGAVAKWEYDTKFFKLVSSTGDTLKVLPLIVGSTMIYANIEDDCSTKLDSVLATVGLKASLLNLGPDTTICSGSSINLKAGLGYESYLWNNASTNPTITVSTPGIYFVKVTDKCGASAIDSITVSLIENTLKITGPAQKCNNDTIVLAANAGFKNYKWSPSINVISNGNTAKVNPSLTTLYFLNADAPQGCQVRDSFLVTVNTSPPLNLGNDTSICGDKSITLSAAAGFKNYNWNNGSQASSIIVNSAGLYSLSATYANNCVSKDTIEVKKYPFTKPSLGNDTSICIGTGIRIFAGDYKSYEWSNGEKNANSIIANNKGAYWVKVTDENNCTGSDTINIVNIFKNPENFLADKMDKCYGDEIRLQSTKQFVNYLWSTGGVGSSILINNFGTFQLSVTDQNGCVGTDSTIVGEKANCPSAIYFPSAFTPNNDGLNDIFQATVFGRLRSFKMNVYDRLGELIFSTTDYKKVWDGKIKGMPGSVGVYVWVCSYELEGGKPAFEKGKVTLIR